MKGTAACQQHPLLKVRSVHLTHSTLLISARKSEFLDFKTQINFRMSSQKQPGVQRIKCLLSMDSIFRNFFFFFCQINIFRYIYGCFVLNSSIRLKAPLWSRTILFSFCLKFPLLHYIYCYSLWDYILWIFIHGFTAIVTNVTIYISLLQWLPCYSLIYWSPGSLLTGTEVNLQ